MLYSSTLICCCTGDGHKTPHRSAKYRARLAGLQAGDVGPMQEFGALFDSVKFRKGLQLNFTSDKDGALITQVDNQQVNPSHSYQVYDGVYGVMDGHYEHQWSPSGHSCSCSIVWTKTACNRKLLTSGKQ